MIKQHLIDAITKKENWNTATWSIWQKSDRSDWYHRYDGQIGLIKEDEEVGVFYVNFNFRMVTCLDAGLCKQISDNCFEFKGDDGRTYKIDYLG